MVKKVGKEENMIIKDPERKGRNRKSDLAFEGEYLNGERNGKGKFKW